MNFETKIKISQKLNNRDYYLLKNLYYYRCLSLIQAWDLCYRDAGVDVRTFIKKRISPFIKLNLIKLSHSGKTFVITITDDGIAILSDKISLNNDYFDIQSKKMRTGILKESSIRILPRLMNHQIALNQFVVDFSRRYSKSNKDVPFHYFDEKFVSKYKFIRPDGMISLSNMDLFLEMDMGTESKKQLIDKWNNYRLFLDKNNNVNKTKIIVLFIVGNLADDKIKTRKNIIKHTLSETMIDDFEDCFDVYIGTKEELLNAVFEKILPFNYGQYFLEPTVINKLLIDKFKFTCDNGSKLKKLFYNSSYGYYIREINEQRRIRRRDSKIQEFLFDDYFYEPASILNRIEFHAKHSSIFEVYYRRPIDYIVLVSSIEDIYNDLSIANLLDINMVYYTTLERLVKMPLYEALFQFDSTGNLYHFKDLSFKEKLLEYNMNK